MTHARYFFLFFLSTAFAFGIASAQEITFGFRPPVPGQRSKSSTDMKLKMNLHVEAEGEAQDVEIGNSKSLTWRETVVAVRDSASTQMKTVYDAFEEQNENPMEEQGEKFAPAIGREYLIDRRDTVTATATDGRALPDTEMSYLRDQYSRITFDEGFSAFVRGRSFRTGVKTVINKELASTVFEAIRDEKGVKEFSVTLRETRVTGGIACGVFDIILRVQTDMGPLAVDMDITGEAVMRIADSRPVSFLLKGPMQMAASESAFAVSGSGEFRASMTRDYSGE